VQTSIASGSLANGSNTIRVCVTDAATNQGSTTATVTKDTTAPTAAITYSPTGNVRTGDSLVITATFSEAMADSPVPQISISGANTVAPTNMTKTDSTHYTYTYTVGSGHGTNTVSLSTGTDLAGNVVTSTPTSGATFISVGQPTKLAVTAITAASVGQPFSVTVQSQDENGNASNVNANTGVLLTRKTGTGTLGGIVSGTISAGSDTLTINNTYYSKIENGVVLTASRTSGDNLAAGDSAPFNVVGSNMTDLPLRSE
jgi:hypothetical protein